MKPFAARRLVAAALAALALAAAPAPVASPALAQARAASAKSAPLDLAQGEKRVALVVGNSAYPEAPLKNPVNDARAMADALRGRGFEVILRVNATKPQMESAAADFGEKLTEGATGIFFFAGHGIQVNGRNYLIPVDARITSEQRVRLETLDVEAVLDQMAAARARVSMVILDACRNNPFERRFRSAGSGLAQISAPEGTLLAYATAPGKTAADGEGANGLYTRELLRAINTPGLKVEDVFKQVRVNVSRASNGAQVPWEASSLTGDFYFQPPVAVAAAPPTPAPAPAAPAAPPPMVQGDRELAFWDSIKTSTDAGDFRDYLAQYPNGSFAPLARRRIATLEAAAAPRPAPAPQAAAPPPAPAPAAASPVPPAAAPTPPAAPRPAPSAAPQVAALPPASGPIAGQFTASFPAGTIATGAVALLAEIDGGEIWLSSGGATSCHAQGRIDARGEIRPIDLRCTASIGSGRGGSEINDFSRIAGRAVDEGGRTVLLLQWRNSGGRSGEVTALPRGAAPAAAPAPAAPAPAARPPVAAPAPAAPPPVAALPPGAAPLTAKFDIAFPAVTVARSAVTLLADIGEGEIWLSVDGNTNCFGRGRVGADGTIQPFDLRCVTAGGGGGRGGGGEFTEQARISGRVGLADGRPTLELEWRTGSGAAGTVRGMLRGGGAAAPSPSRARFALSFPAGSLARNPVEAELEVDGDRASFSGGGAGATCTGAGRADAAGTIAAFDVRCIGIAAGQNTQGWSTVSGRIASEGGVPVLRLAWRNAQQVAGELRAAAR